MPNNFKQGVFNPTNPDKWIINENSLGKGRIEFRSGWEHRFCNYCDLNSSILKVSSEPFAIKYYLESDRKMHRYYPDFYLKMRTKSGEIVERLIEIKPGKETKPPRKNKNKARYLKECLTYMRNTAKWEAADKWCQENGMQFLIMDEYSLGLKK